MAEPPRPHPTTDPDDKSGLPHGDAPLRILLVDDSRSFRFLTARTLKKHGWHVTEASCVAEGLTAHRPEAFDIVVTDYEMPDMNGLVLMQTLHAERSPHIPVIITTIHEDLELALRVMREGAVDFVPKSSGDAALVAAVQRASRLALRERRLKEETTERREVEAALRRSNESLNARFREKISSLNDLNQELTDQIVKAHQTNAQLKEAQYAAEAANRAKSDFLANMSHELRTPMTAILGFTDLLTEVILSAEGPPEGNEAVRTIRRNSEYLLAIIDNLLDLCKIDADKLTINEAPCSPSGLADDVAATMRAQAQAKGLSIETTHDTAVPGSVQTDPVRLKQILINLVANAVKFTEHGGVQIRTSVVQNNTGQSTLRFDVIDTGIGIQPDQRDRLFEPLTQADEAMTRQFGGVGLGLTISMRLAQLLGGQLTVDSEPSQGSTFSMLLPVKTLNPAASPKQTDRFDYRILVVEDSVDNQRLISFVLKKAGAQVVVAENGQVGVDHALSALDEGHPFDCILMDMQMPVLDGYQATNLLREKGYSHPIIALTAHAMTGDREKCLNAGCDDYTTKPLDKQTLISLISSYAQPSTDRPASAA